MRRPANIPFTKSPGPARCAGCRGLTNGKAPTGDRRAIRFAPDSATQPFGHRVCERRGGFTMVELTVAAGLLGMVFLAAIPLLSRVRETREDAQQRFIALQEAANAMEQLALDVADGTVPDAAGKALSVSAEARDLLPEVSVEATAGEQPDDAGSVRVTVTVSWINDAGEPAAPVTLDAWLPVRKEQP